MRGTKGRRPLRTQQLPWSRLMPLRAHGQSEGSTAPLKRPPSIYMHLYIHACTPVIDTCTFLPSGQALNSQVKSHLRDHPHKQTQLQGFLYCKRRPGTGEGAALARFLLPHPRDQSAAGLPSHHHRKHRGHRRRAPFTTCHPAPRFCFLRGALEGAVPPRQA